MADFKFEDQLFLFLPEAMRGSDTQEVFAIAEVVTTWNETLHEGYTGAVGMGQLERLIRMFGLHLDKYRYIIDALPTFWDIEDVDIQFLPYIAAYLGWDLDRNLTPIEQRKIVKQVVQLYKKKGTRDAFTSLFTAIGFDVDIIEFEPTHRFRLGAISRDNLNTLYLPNVEKLVKQIEWQRPINAVFLGLRFTKYLPERFDEAQQTWVADTEVTTITDAFERAFLKQNPETIPVSDTISGSHISGYFQEWYPTVGQALKYNGQVRYGEKFSTISANYWDYSEDLTHLVRTGIPVSIASGLSSNIPAGALTGWQLVKPSGTTTSYYEMVYSGTPTDIDSGSRWTVSIYVASGLAVGGTDGTNNSLRVVGYQGSTAVGTLQISTADGTWDRKELTLTTVSAGGTLSVRMYPGYSPIVTGLSSIRVSCPKLERQLPYQPTSTIYLPTSGTVLPAVPGRYPTMYHYNYPVISGGLPSEGMVIWKIRSTDGTIDTKVEVVTS